MFTEKSKSPTEELQSEIAQVRAIATECFNTFNHYKTYYFPTWEEKFSQFNHLDDRLLKLEKRLDAITSYLLGDEVAAGQSSVDFVSKYFRPVDKDLFVDSLIRIQNAHGLFKEGMAVLQIFSGDGSVGIWLQSLGVSFLGIEHSEIVRSFAQRMRSTLRFLPLDGSTIRESLLNKPDLVLILLRRSEWSVDDAVDMLELVLNQPINEVIISLPHAPEIFRLRQWDFFERIQQSKFICKELGGSDKSRDHFFYLTRGGPNG